MMKPTPKEYSVLNTVQDNNPGLSTKEGENGNRLAHYNNQDTLERFAGNCMESHNQGPRTAKRVTSNSEIAKDLNMRQLITIS